MYIHRSVQQNCGRCESRRAISGHHPGSRTASTPPGRKRLFTTQCSAEMPGSEYTKTQFEINHISGPSINLNIQKPCMHRFISHRNPFSTSIFNAFSTTAYRAPFQAFISRSISSSLSASMWSLSREGGSKLSVRRPFQSYSQGQSFYIRYRSFWT